MSAKQLGDASDAPSQKDIGKLLLESQELMFNRLEGLLSNVLIESQAKLVESLTRVLESQFSKLLESQTKHLEFQENTQPQVSEIVRRSISDTAGDEYFEEEKEEGNHTLLFDYIAEEDDGVAIFIEDGTCYELVDAVTKNNWEAAKRIYEADPEAINRGLTNISSTMLHLAVGYNASMTFVEEVVKRMTPTAVAYRSTECGDTALHTAGFYYGRTEAAKLMVNKNPTLTQIRNKEGLVPLEYALHYLTIGQKEIVEYLYSVTQDIDPSPFVGHDGARLLCTAIDANFYGMALSLVERFPKLVMEKSLVHGMCALELLAQRPFTFRSGAKLTWWQNCMYSIIQVDHVGNDDTENEWDEESEWDEETLSENSGGTKAVEGLISSSQRKVTRIVTNLFSSCLKPWLTRALPIKNLQNQKLMHQQTTALLKQMLVKILKVTRNRSEILDFLKDNPNIMKTAIKHGITEFMVESLEQFNFFLTYYRLPEHNVLEMAVAERNELIVNLICESTNDKNDLVSKTDNDGNTILHHAAKLARPSQLNSIPGVAIQMQRELHWFKGVESIMSENDKFKRNKKGETAHFLFTEEHKKLVKEGEDWMKDTSGSCMIVTALIATVAFAAAFTVPGGNISDSNSTKNGTPVFLGQASFTVFVVADALALTSSVTSVLMFLAIYTSRYAETDFLKSLPRKLIIGLATLFISMAAILVAFCASLFIVVEDKYPQGLIPITLFGCAPAALFAWLQLPLFYEMVRSTYWGGVLGNHRYMDPRFEKKNNKKKESILSRVKKFITSFRQ
ncbi:uncharacterized protein LOC113308343 isoform X1 [Papaver somniferum]|uniref:uncharacterized protein LOC113308343 isoform X1 n=1 Tax=Papaver somniferum TaxID=3469 RepID=UPI000E703663|nr:uncharacterized protein LOC113308343 isoform X1 [Papaver somniferum]